MSAAHPGEGVAPVDAERPSGVDRLEAAPAVLGPNAGPDTANAEVLNRFDCYSVHDWTEAYPGEPKIYRPDEVRGRNVPAALHGD